MLDFLKQPSLNPFDGYAYMREHHPIYEDEQGVWHVFCYEDVKEVLSNYAIFSSKRSGDIEAYDPISASLISQDPPRHRLLRSLVSQAFTPKAIAALQPRIQEITKELFHHLHESASPDFVKQFSYPLPVIVIAELLGVPSSDQERFKEWSDAIVTGSHALENGEEITYDNAQQEMIEYFSQIISSRKKSPKDDLISRLLEAQIDGEALSHMDILGFCILLLVAGNETTTNLLSNAIYTFHNYPDVWHQLKANPELTDQAVEETLRYRSPVQNMSRLTISETVLSGRILPPGKFVVAWIGSANRDDRVFPQANEFILTRTNLRHVAFGHGIHFCLGAPLARLEASIALRYMLDVDFQFVVDEKRSELINSNFVYGFSRMPLEQCTSSL